MKLSNLLIYISISIIILVSSFQTYFFIAIEIIIVKYNSGEYVNSQTIGTRKESSYIVYNNYIQCN